MWWKEYVLSIIACVLICGVITQFSFDSRHKKLIQLVCGTLLALILMSPMLSVDIADTLDLNLDGFSPEEYIDMGRREAEAAQKACIKEACESYISSRANDFGLIITASVHLDANMQPVTAQIYVQSDSDQTEKLKQILEEDLGITKENQSWIWNQEKDSS